MRLLCTFVLLLITSVASAAPIKVAVFEGDGVGKSCTNLLTILDNSSKIQLEVSRVTTADIVAGKLDEFDVLIHPGGSGSKQGNDLGEDGRQQVRQFVSQGGGFLGVCAGAYLATNDYTWSLNLIDA